MYFRLALNSWYSSCLNLLKGSITGIHHHTWILVFFDQMLLMACLLSRSTFLSPVNLTLYLGL